MRLFNFLKRTQSKSKPVDSNGLIGMHTLVNIPKRQNLSSEKIELLNRYVSYYESIIKKEENLMTVKLATDLYDRMEMYTSLLLDQHLSDKDNKLLAEFHETYFPELENKINILKIKIYLQKINDLQIETTLRIVALIEIGNRTLSERKRQTIQDEINNLETTLVTFGIQISAITKEVDTYLKKQQFSVYDLYKTELAKTKRDFYAFLYHVADLVFPEAIKDIYCLGHVPEMDILKGKILEIVKTIKEGYQKGKMPKNLQKETNIKQKRYEDIMDLLAFYYLPLPTIESAQKDKNNVIERMNALERELSKYIPIDSDIATQENDRALLERTKILFSMPWDIVPEELGVKTLEDSQSIITVAALEIFFEEYVYSHKDILTKIDEYVKSVAFIGDIEQIEEIESYYRLFDRFGRNLINRERVNQLYTLKFRLLTFDGIDEIKPFDEKDMNYAEAECYQNIIIEKIKYITTGQNVVLRVLFGENFIQAIKIIKQILLSDDNGLATWNILKDPVLLKFLLSLEDDEAFVEFFKNTKISLNSEHHVLDESGIKLHYEFPIDTMIKLTSREKVEGYYKELHDLYSMWYKRRPNYEFPYGIIGLKSYTNNELLPDEVKKIREDATDKNIIFTHSVENISAFLPSEVLSITLAPQYKMGKLISPKSSKEYENSPFKDISLTSDPDAKKIKLNNLVLANNVYHIDINAFDIENLAYIHIPIESPYFQSFDGISEFIRTFYKIQKHKIISETYTNGPSEAYSIEPKSYKIIIAINSIPFELNISRLSCDITKKQAESPTIIEEKMSMLVNLLINELRQLPTESNDFLKNWLDEQLATDENRPKRSF